MKRDIIRLLVFIITTTVFSCTEPYQFEVNDYEKILIVQGIITNQDGPYEVKLSRTLPLAIDDDSLIYETGALVTISDNSGNLEIFQEVSPGVYKSSTGGMKGELGKEYTLAIYTSDGVEYESDPVILRPVPEIDSVYATYRENYSFEEDKIIRGVDINVDTKEWENDDFYFKWDYVETWKIIPPFEKMGEVITPCWQIDYCDKIVIENPSSFSVNKLEQQPIIYLSENSPKPHYGYSVLINQYSINESVFQFWRMVKETKENGSLFDNIPYNPICNIHCCNNGNTKVIGYFDASSVSSKRVYFKKAIFDIKFADINEGCKEYWMEVNEFETIGPPSTPYIIDAADGKIIYTMQKECVDCSVISTTTEKPDFWDYDD